jgi:hypothetical protein
MKHFYLLFAILTLTFSCSGLYSQEKLYTNPTNIDKSTPSSQDYFERPEWQPPFNSEWVDNDVLVDTGDVYNLGIRPIALKMGPDGYLYLAHNKKPPTGQPLGRINIFRSHNGGQNWSLIGSISTTTGYFGQMSMLVEDRTPGEPDSTRVIIFYTRSNLSSMLNASINWASIRRNGSGFIGGIVLSNPSTNGKFFYPAAVSNGQYESSNTAFGCVVGEYNNISEVSMSFRFFRTTNWGDSWGQSVLTDPEYPAVSDYFPTADFKKGTVDSVYIACERRSSTDSSIRIISTPWTPTPNTARRYLISGGADNYEKPVITILQNTAASNERQMMITMTKTGGRAVYSYTTNSGANWVHDNMLGLATQTRTRFTYCSSDTNAAGGGNFVACFVNNIGNSGDSITVVRGTLQNMVGITHKVNEFSSSFIVNPVCTIFNNGTLNFSATAYAGTGPVNVYFDGENLPVGISSNGSHIPAGFRLSQNYPNPFNPSTKIDFSLPSSSVIKLAVYDVLGKEVALITNSRYERGNYTVNFDASRLAGGIYFYRLITESFSETKKMVVLK